MQNTKVKMAQLKPYGRAIQCKSAQFL